MANGKIYSSSSFEANLTVAILDGRLGWLAGSNLSQSYINLEVVFVGTNVFKEV